VVETVQKQQQQQKQTNSVGMFFNKTRQLTRSMSITVMSSNSVVKFLCFLRLLLGELVIGGVATRKKWRMLICSDLETESKVNKKPKIF